MNTPKNLLYSKTHEWVRKEGADVAVIGITDFAQKALGDIVFVDFKVTIGDKIAKQAAICDLESVKAVESVYLPISGVIKELNTKLEEDFSQMNKSCYEHGWLVKIKIQDPKELTALLKTEDYVKLCDQESTKKH
jgi:glycine cleavage system H protein